MTDDAILFKEADHATLGRWTTSCLLRRYVSRMPVPDETVTTGQDDLQSVIAGRRRVLREISLRRGQSQFRERLIRRYGLRCQISGYDFAAAVEAAHIRPYAVCEENGAGNGLLLRSDLHTLFDLGFIGIDPSTLRVSFNPACLCAEYTAYEGAMLSVNGTRGPDVSALAERWEFFQCCLSGG